MTNSNWHASEPSRGTPSDNYPAETSQFWGPLEVIINLGILCCFLSHKIWDDLLHSSRKLKHGPGLHFWRDIGRDGVDEFHMLKFVMALDNLRDGQVICWCNHRPVEAHLWVEVKVQAGLTVNRSANTSALVIKIWKYFHASWGII